jgi:hypothetical protein
MIEIFDYTSERIYAEANPHNASAVPSYLFTK